MREARLLTVRTASPSWSFTPCCRSSNCDCAFWKRALISCARASTTLRAVTSVGVLAMSEKALIRSLTDAPRPLLPPWKMSSSDASRSARVLSIACTERASAACRVRNSLCARSIVPTCTPLPT